MSQLNLPHGTNNKKWKTEKLQKCIGKQSGESIVLKKKGRLRREGFAEKEGFNPGMKE